MMSADKCEHYHFSDFIVSIVDQYVDPFGLCVALLMQWVEMKDKLLEY